MTPADLDSVALLAWVEAEQQRTREAANAATDRYLRSPSTGEVDAIMARNEAAHLTGRYVALAEIARRIITRDFDRRP